MAEGFAAFSKLEVRDEYFSYEGEKKLVKQKSNGMIGDAWSALQNAYYKEWVQLEEQAQKATTVHIISTPWGGTQGYLWGTTNSDGLAEVNRRGAEVAAKEKLTLHNPKQGSFCFNPNTDIGPIAKAHGWDAAMQEKKWLEIFARMMRIAQGKPGSTVRFVKHREEDGTASFVGNAQGGEREMAEGFSIGKSPLKIVEVLFD
jgi:hypothetical protein